MLKEDEERGQLVKGHSDWGSAAFLTKVMPGRKVQRKRRPVVDYRRLNSVTIRKVFLIPHGDSVKGAVSGCWLVSVGDLKEGFNQIANTAEAARKLAVISPSGTWLPQGLTFGPTNGPEDFQEAVYIIFSRQLLKTWCLFVDDLAVATGKKGIGAENLEKLGENSGRCQ